MTTDTYTPTAVKPLRIAFFTDDYRPYVHGVVSSIDNYRAALEKRGHEVFIVAPKVPDYDDNDDHVIRMPAVNSLVFDKRPVAMLYPGMERRMRKYQFDVVHSHTQFYLGILAKMVANKQNIPHFTTMHTIYTELIDDYPGAVIAGLIAVSVGYPIALKTKPVISLGSLNREEGRMSAREMMKKQGWKLMNMFFAHVDYCISPSQHLLDKLLEHGLEAPHEVLPNGIDITRYGKRNPDVLPRAKGKNEKWITAVGRLSGEKRQAALVAAMQHISNPDYKLILVGDGPERERLERRVEELELQDRVYFFGVQPAEVVAAVMAESDLFCLASYRFDNQPMVILEAIASGLPVVYCDDHLLEGLSDQNAALTDGIEGTDFAKTFQELLSNPAQLSKMSAKSKALAKQFDVNRLAERLETLYAEIIGLNSSLER